MKIEEVAKQIKKRNLTKENFDYYRRNKKLFLLEGITVNKLQPMIKKPDFEAINFALQENILDIVKKSYKELASKQIKKKDART